MLSPKTENVSWRGKKETDFEIFCKSPSLLFIKYFQIPPQREDFAPHYIWHGHLVLRSFIFFLNPADCNTVLCNIYISCQTELCIVCTARKLALNWRAALKRIFLLAGRRASVEIRHGDLWALPSAAYIESQGAKCFCSKCLKKGLKN